MDSPQFIEVCAQGDYDAFDAVFSSLSPEQKKYLMEYDRCFGFHLAVSGGNYRTVKAMLRYIKSVTDLVPAEEAVIPFYFSRDGEGFKNALLGKHFDVVAALLEEEFLFSHIIDLIMSDRDYIKIIWNSPLPYVCVYIFELACWDNLFLVKNMWKVLPNSFHDLIFKTKFHQLPITNILKIDHALPFETACQSGNLKILRILWQLLKPMRELIIENQFESSLILAAKNGHLEIVKQLVIWLDSFRRIAFLSAKDFSAFIYAADRGFYRIVDYILEQLPYEIKANALKASNYAAYRLAFKAGHSSIVDLLEENATRKELDVMKKAIHEGVKAPKRLKSDDL